MFAAIHRRCRRPAKILSMPRPYRQLPGTNSSNRNRSGNCVPGIERLTCPLGYALQSVSGPIAAVRGVICRRQAGGVLVRATVPLGASRPGTRDVCPHGGNQKGTPLHNGDVKGFGDAENPRDREPDSSHEHPREGEADTYPLPAPALLVPPADGAYFWSGRTSEGVGSGSTSADGNGAADI